MTRYIKTISYWCIFITLPIIIILTSVEMLAFDKGFYENKYDQYQVVENTGIEKNELMRITDEMLDYLKGERQDLRIFGKVQGEERLIFDQRDQAHMVDVQYLFIRGKIIRNILAVLLLFSLFYLLWIKKHKRSVARVVLKSLISFTVIIVVLAIVIATDFSKYFNLFHSIFFDNDLWQLDPRKSILINLVPLSFFVDAVIRLGIYIFGSFAVGTLLSGLYLKKAPNR